MDVLLVAQPGIAREQYLALLHDFGARVRVATEPAEVFAELRGGDFSGLVFDEPTLLADGRFDPGVLRSLSERYPALHVMHDADTDQIYVLGNRQYPSSRHGVAAFVAACRDFSPPAMRSGPRSQATLPVLLSRDFADPAAGVEATMTLNVSRLGCFVFSVTAWERGDEGWLIFDDVDPRPVLVRVVWRQPWGSRRAAGLGLGFVEPHEALLSEIARLEAGLAP
ncbi:PilZ domain-containing protein [Solidesulfovibrio sp.]